MIAVFAPRSELFFEFPDVADRVLYRGVVTDAVGDSLTARFCDPAIHAKPGTELRCYAMRDDRFAMQFAAVQRVDAWISCDDEITTSISVELIGTPVASERRESLRVSAYGSDLVADLEGEYGCTVPDVSESGLSVLARVRIQVGAVVDIVLHTEGQALRGRGSVQNAKRLENGLTRYGIFVVKARNSALGDSMGRITETLQRQQMRVLASTR